MIQITKKQIRQIALGETKRKPINESVDLTSDALADSLASGIKQQLSGKFASKIVSDFFASGKRAGMMFPAKKEDAEMLKSQVSQKIMTRLGSDLLSFVEALVNNAVLDQNAGLQNESKILESSNVPDDYSTCKKCNLDHEYEYVAAAKWHDENDER